MDDIALLDTNVLLLLLVAWTDASLLRRFKRVSQFRQQDVDLLVDLVLRFRGLLTTPHVLAEVSNFLDQAPQQSRSEIQAALKLFIRRAEEIFERSSLLIDRAEFDALGLADTGLSALSDRATVITTDFHLHGRILQRGGRCINFQQLRSTELA